MSRTRTACALSSNCAATRSSGVILNNLFKHTPMQSVFSMNMVALVDGQPRLLNLRQILQVFIPPPPRCRHPGRTIFELRKARERAHILEGLAVALTNIDEIIALIKGSASPAIAKDELIARAWKPGEVTRMLERSGADVSRPEGLEEEYGMQVNEQHIAPVHEYRLSPAQAQAILDLRLHRLTSLEQDKIVKDYGSLLDKIRDLLDILQDPEKLMQVIREELGDRP